MQTTLDPQIMEALLHGECADVFSHLGMHPLDEGWVVRVFWPEAASVRVVERGGQEASFEAAKTHAEGLFEARVAGRRSPFAYHLAVTDAQGAVRCGRDPYSFRPQLASQDQYLFNEGTHYRAYEMLGAHPRCIDGAEGTYFAVWAPNARRVSVVGDFNHWDGRPHCMRSLGASGVWELFVPEVGAGALYKYEILSRQGTILLKSDPFALATERPPRTASAVCRDDAFAWGDDAWMAECRACNGLEAPLAIYEVQLGSWRRNLDYRTLAHQLVAHVAALGFTHIELMPVAEYPFDGSWGYQGTGYFAPTARFGAPEDFAYFIDYCHRHAIGVILDWVPAHFPSDAHGLAQFDGTSLYEHCDPRQGWHPDWQTCIFNYGRAEVRSFLISNALFWLERFHLDGLRVDAVTSMLYLDYSRSAGEWVPNAHGGRENLEAVDFLRQLNAAINEHCPDALMIAEESTAWPEVSRPAAAGGLGFHFKWNMGWMNDVLRYMQCDPIHRRDHQDDLTFGLLYAHSENFVLPLAHDEVVHGKRSLLNKMPGDAWQQRANLRLLYGFMYGHPGKKLLFMGAELAQWDEWDHQGELPWHLLDDEGHAGVYRWLCDLNQLYRRCAALHRTDAQPAGFEWIDCSDAAQSVVAFVRRAEGEPPLIFVCNFTPVPRADYQLGLPAAGPYREVLNSDAEIYGGSGLGHGGWVQTEPVACHGRPQSARLHLPPLGALVLEPMGHA